MNANHGQTLFATEHVGAEKSVRQIELELQKIRLEAEAIRLEARATELLLWLEQVARGTWSDPPPSMQPSTANPQPAAPNTQGWDQREMQAWRRLAESHWCQDLLKDLHPAATDPGFHQPRSPSANPPAPSPLNTTPLHSHHSHHSPLHSTPLHSTQHHSTQHTPLTPPLNTTPLTPLHSTPLTQHNTT